MEWRGKGVDETGVDASSGRTIVRIDPRYFRPAEVESLLGDPSKAKAKLGWTATVSFADLINEMVVADRELARRDALIERGGFKTYRYRE